MRTTLEDNQAFGVRHYSAKYASVNQTLVGDYTILADGPTIHVLNPGGSTRNINLPALTEYGGQLYLITNVGPETITVRDSLGVTVTTLTDDQTGLFFSSASVWKFLKGGVSLGDVVGPGSSLDGELVLFDGLTGKVIKPGGVVVSAFAKTILDDADAATVLATIGAQPSDSDLTAIAALTTTAYGRSLLTLANAAALAAEVDAFFLTPAEGNAAYQPLDSDLTSIAALTTTAFGRGLLTLADAAAGRTAFGVVIGTDVQAFDADLTALAALTGTNTIYYRSAANTWTAVTIGSGLTFSGGTLATSGGGSGDVVGPASATDNAIARFDTTTGKLLQNSAVTIADTTGLTAGMTFPNAAGVRILDTNASHLLTIRPGSDLTADRDFTLTTGDAARTLNISAADVTISAFGATLTDDADAPAARATLGVAYGKQSIWVPAGAMSPRSSNGCAPLATVETATNKVNLKTLDFDAAADEFAQFFVRMPKSWDESTVTAVFVWKHAATATNFAVVWGIQGVSLSNDDAADTAFGTAVTVTDTGGTTNDIYLSDETAAITIGNTPAEGDWVCFQIYRDADAGGDTMTIDAGLLGVLLLWTNNASNDS